MLIEHAGRRPRIDPSARVAPTAVICGQVTLGPGTSVGFGAVLSAESGPVTVGAHCVIMENAVLRGTRRHGIELGDHVLVGPRASLSGCTIADQVFLATGSTVFNGAVIGQGAEVRVNGTVHLRTRLAAGAVVSIGWVPVGDPAQILPPERHDEIWRVQEPLDFPHYVFGVQRPASGETNMVQVTRRYSAFLGRHGSDRILDDDPKR
jgi:carbonic anhydrase/acetyltransferase-like protein (isoleucine patch superfamily)